MTPSRDRRRQGGFTLIEVLLVLVILVVLASLATVAYGPIQRRVKVNSARTQIGLLKNAIQTYQLSVETYPPTLDALRVPPPDMQNSTKWDGPYLDADVPLDPWGNPYQYAVPGSHNNDFDIWTVSPDGQEIGNWTEIKR